MRYYMYIIVWLLNSAWATWSQQLLPCYNVVQKRTQRVTHWARAVIGRRSSNSRALCGAHSSMTFIFIVVRSKQQQLYRLLCLSTLESKIWHLKLHAFMYQCVVIWCWFHNLSLQYFNEAVLRYTYVQKLHLLGSAIRFHAAQSFRLELTSCHFWLLHAFLYGHFLFWRLYSLFNLCWISIISHLESLGVTFTYSHA